MSAPTTTPAVFNRTEAKEADRVLNELMFMHSGKAQYVVYAIDTVRRLVDRQTGWGRDREWGKTWDQALAEVTERAATADPEKPWTQREAQAALDKLAAARAEERAAHEAVKAQSALWAAHGCWMRYSVVPGGHIHTDWRDCHTLRDTTTVLWAYQASGDSVDEAIEVYGTVLCTHCFPDAPVAYIGGKTLTDANGNVLTKAEAAAIADAKAAEKAAKLAAKNAKAVFVPGTTDLVLDKDLREIKTERSLVTAIIDMLSNNGYYAESLNRRSSSATKRDRKTGEVISIDESYPTYGEWLTYAYTALAAKHGKTVDEVKAEMNKKLRARNARG
jgi:hypothetical protein